MGQPLLLTDPRDALAQKPPSSPRWARDLLVATALSFRPAGRSFGFVAFRLVWVWRYELLWPSGFSRRGRRGGHAHAASPQHAAMRLPRRVAEWSTNSGTPSLDQEGLACAIYALALFGQLGGRERWHTCHPNATFTTRRRSLGNGSTACPRLPSTTTGERRTSMSTARRVHISTMKRPFR